MPGLGEAIEAHGAWACGSHRLPFPAFAGLLANADYAEDFKFFTLMVQSKGSALYRVSGEGGLGV